MGQEQKLTYIMSILRAELAWTLVWTIHAQVSSPVHDLGEKKYAHRVDNEGTGTLVGKSKKQP